MEYFLGIQSTYQTVEFALFNKEELVNVVHEDKVSASTYFFSRITDLLEQNSLTLEDISFITANNGPGPFTTLRVVIASVNGISFARNIPLIGIDSLHALLSENAKSDVSVTVALLNAFGQDVYFAVQQDEKIIQESCKNISALLTELKNNYPHKKIRFIGSGTQLFKSHILHVFGDLAQIPEPLPENASIQHIGKLAWHRWQDKKDLSKKLEPIYLKQTI